MFYDILDVRRKEILPLLANFKLDFYLAGGTGLALQFGHRDSIDFDFFTEQAIDTVVLYEKIISVFADHRVEKIQEEKNTLSVFIDGSIKVSFFTYRYPLLEPCLDEPFFSIASMADIGCMKLSAIVSRSTNKDYIDLYYILKKISLADLLIMAEEKMPDLDTNLVLKSLVYFEDIVEEPIRFKGAFEVTLKRVEQFLIERVKNR